MGRYVPLLNQSSYIIELIKPLGMAMGIGWVIKVAQSCLGDGQLGSCTLISVSENILSLRIKYTNKEERKTLCLMETNEQLLID